MPTTGGALAFEGFTPRYEATLVTVLVKCSEARLIELAYAFERATRRRVPPPSAP